MIYVGIDNGVNGGIAAIDSKQQVIFMAPMPVLGHSKKEYDSSKLLHIFQELSKNGAKIAVILEKAQPQFRDGSKQAFKTGYGFGLIQGILTALGVSYEIVGPKIWQKEIFQGNVENTKHASIMFCKKKYPGIDLTPTERSTKDHDGISDAIAMAVYSYRRNK